MFFYTIIALALSSPMPEQVGATYMDCAGIPYCGILALERGEGGGKYDHISPSVHGLWPQTGKYGNSDCLHAPQGQRVSAVNVSCYDDVVFQQHEWDAHGYCASPDPQSYFDTVCSLSQGPVAAMKTLRDQGKALKEIVQEMIKLGYPIIDAALGYDQLAITVCAGKDLVWKIAAQSEFKVKCAS